MELTPTPIMSVIDNGLDFVFLFVFDQILELTPAPKHAVIENGLDFILLFSINQVGRWFDEVWSISSSFVI